MLLVKSKYEVTFELSPSFHERIPPLIFGCNPAIRPKPLFPLFYYYFRTCNMRMKIVFINFRRPFLKGNHTYILRKYELHNILKDVIIQRWKREIILLMPPVWT